MHVTGDSAVSVVVRSWCVTPWEACSRSMNYEPVSAVRDEMSGGHVTMRIYSVCPDEVVLRLLEAKRATMVRTERPTD